MPDILQLNDFTITRLLVDWIAPDVPAANEEPLSAELVIDYDVLRNPDAPYSMALQFRIKLAPHKGKKIGYIIEAEIVGFFDFPETMSEEQVQYLIRVNGGTILYGILRGQISLFTGSFPGGKFMLPAVYMPDVANEVEERKQKIRNDIAHNNKVSAKKQKNLVTKKKAAVIKKKTASAKKKAAR